MKYRIVSQSYLRQGHIDAIHSLFETIECVEVAESGDDYMIIDVPEDLVPVIDDMVICDYISAHAE